MLWNEIKKFWQYRSLIVILILALLLNLGVFVYSQRGNRLLRSEWGHVVELTQAFSDVEEAQAYVAEKTGSTHSGYDGTADGYSGF